MRIKCLCLSGESCLLFWRQIGASGGGAGGVGGAVLQKPLGGSAVNGKRFANKLTADLLLGPAFRPVVSQSFFFFFFYRAYKKNIFNSA